MRPGVIYFRCQQCGHNLSAYRALTEAGLWSKGQVSKNDAMPFASRMKCSNCLSRSISVCEPIEERPTLKVVSTDRGFNRVYHKVACHFAIKINLEDLREFENEDAAIKQAYVACGHCFSTTRRRY